MKTTTRLAAVAFAGLAVWTCPAGAASTPHSVQLRVPCGVAGNLAGKNVTIPDCKAISNGLEGWFAGRLDWYSGNQLLFQEKGPFFAITASNEGEVDLFLDGNGDAAAFTAMYDTPQTSILAMPDLSWKLFITPANKPVVQVAAQTYMPHAAALWSKRSEDNAAIDGNVGQETAARTAADTALQAAIAAVQAQNQGNGPLAAETAARIAADATALASAKAYTDTAVTNEQMARTAADSAEVTARKAGDQPVGDAINNEAAARTAADAAEAAARAAADAAETTARTNADNALNTALTAEATARAAGDTTVTNLLAAESAARQAAEAALIASVTAESTRAANTEAGLNAAIQTEITRAKLAETMLNGRSVSNVAPKDGQVLAWNTAKMWWEATDPVAALPACNKDQVLISKGGGAYVCKDYCNQKFTDITTDGANCGACGNACMFNNANGNCANSKCAIGQCNNGFADCNNNGNDGCEINLQNDSANCGKCGTACAQGQFCQNGACGAAKLKVAIENGPTFYTDGLRAGLAGQNFVQSVTLIQACDINTLKQYDVVIVWGNQFCNDANAYETYVQGGGGMVATPWQENNYQGSPAYPVGYNGSGAVSTTPLNVTVTNGNDSLLAGVTFHNGDNVGYENAAVTLRGGATQCVIWNNNQQIPAVSKWVHGSGRAVYLNFHYITSDCQLAMSYGWGQTLMYNSVKYAAKLIN